MKPTSKKTHPQPDPDPGYRPSPDSQYAHDAWWRLQQLVADTSAAWRVRPDLKVEALGTERAVRLSIRESVHDDASPLPFGTPHRWVDAGKRNVSTMRELAHALLAACDYVEAVNPHWAAHHPVWNEPLAVEPDEHDA